MMIQTIKEDILHILEHGLEALKKEDIKTLKELSNQTIHNASIYQEENSLAIAVIFYSLFKILERQDYKNYKGWKNFSNQSLTLISSIKKYLEKNDEVNYKKNLTKLSNLMEKEGGKLKYSIKGVFNAAKIHKASRLHEHGISLGKTAELLNISEWELMEYVGRTGISDSDLSISKDVKKRLQIARKLFS